MTRNVVIIEDRLEVALPMATLLEARGFSIVGLIVEQAAALAVAEGEGADFSARVANLPLGSKIQNMRSVAVGARNPNAADASPFLQTIRATRTRGIMISLPLQHC